MIIKPALNHQNSSPTVDGDTSGVIELLTAFTSVPAMSNYATNSEQSYVPRPTSQIKSCIAVRVFSVDIHTEFYQLFDQSPELSLIEPINSFVIDISKTFGQQMNDRRVVRCSQDLCIHIPLQENVDHFDRAICNRQLQRSSHAWIVVVLVKIATTFDQYSCHLRVAILRGEM